jgi:Fe-S cluster assembly ATP-binding protein
MSQLEIRDLVAGVGGRQILNGLSLTVGSGEIHAVMGPNGAGKSTLSYVLMGRAGYNVDSGSVLLDGTELLSLPTWQRAQLGLFLAMQYPIEVPGVRVADVVRASFAARADNAYVGVDVEALLTAEGERIGFADRFFDRSMNVDFSGGEKKRNETVQLATLAPKFAILDELDSGLDVDALRACARRVADATQETGLGVMVITHYSRLLTELRPDRVHVLVKGVVVESGGPELVDELEADGYARFSTTDDEASSSSAYDDLFR